MYRMPIKVKLSLIKDQDVKQTKKCKSKFVAKIMQYAKCCIIITILIAKQLYNKIRFVGYSSSRGKAP